MQYFTKQTIEYSVLGLLVGLALSAAVWNVDPVQWLPYVPLAEGAEALIDWLNDNLGVVFSAITFVITAVLDPVMALFTQVPAAVVITALTILAHLLGGIRVSAFVFFALVFVAATELFDEMMVTLSLVATTTIFALAVGIPVGIIKAHSKVMRLILDPVLDFMQTMPLFVYLIPAVFFFSIGNVPGIVATFIFATPPAVRLTSLGIEQIPDEFLEVGKAFGASFRQLLFKVELPMAMPSVMVGINQTIMLSLSMVVVASMIGAEGLGQEVLRGISRLQVGVGIASGIAVVLLAMILDRLTRAVQRGR